MDDSFDSVFCKRNAFIPALEQLVSSSKARVVVLSYFDGRNHWNDHINGSGTKGFQNLSAFFKSGLFQRGSFSNQPVSRQNYQSYGGYKADRIAEYILSAKRK
jgi:adenine-specific DNA methylase